MTPIERLRRQIQQLNQWESGNLIVRSSVPALQEAREQLDIMIGNLREEGVRIMKELEQEEKSQ